MSAFDIAQICKLAGEVLAFVTLISASASDVKTREVSNGHVFGIVAIFALASFGAWFLFPESMPLTSIATQFVFAIGIGFFLLVVTVGIEKVMDKEIFGGADIKVVAATCLFLDAESLMAAMIVACASMLVASVFERRKFASWSAVTLPFVPFWTAGFAVGVVLTHVL